MVSNVALLFTAVGVVQTARTLPSPYKEILIVAVCAGVLFGGALMQEAERERRGVPLPPGWRWFHYSTGSPGSSDAPPEPPEDGTILPEVMSFAGSAPNAEDSLALVLLPGNPGIPHFYCMLTEKFHEALISAGLGPATVYLMAYGNFATTAKGAAACEAAGPQDLDETAVGLSVAMAAVRRLHRRRGTVIVGHSCGAFSLTHHLLKEHVVAAERREPNGDESTPMGKVLLAVYLMPFLETSGTLHQKSALFMTRLPLFKYFIKVLSLSILLLPDNVKRKLAEMGDVTVDSQKQQVIETIGKQPHLARGVMRLLGCELTRMDPALHHEAAGFDELHPLMETSTRPPVLAVFTPGDAWCPMTQAARLKRMMAETDELVDLGDAEHGCVVSGEVPPHGLPCSEPHLLPVAKLIASRVAARLGQKGGAKD